MSGLFPFSFSCSFRPPITCLSPTLQSRFLFSIPRKNDFSKPTSSFCVSILFSASNPLPSIPFPHNLPGLFFVFCSHGSRPIDSLSHIVSLLHTTSGLLNHHICNRLDPVCSKRSEARALKSLSVNGPHLAVEQTSRLAARRGLSAWTRNNANLQSRRYDLC